ncbi:hypothetical protein BE17_07250 [Sorangium cellulosum]|uniref:Uncharacterized protein n=1 Tax=Sorangium cellulosum TaxID=56 RepID=A0A150S518_SORCE|nr:hypothetical protein BE17_07250 [Sorangium cellulosum]
MKRETRAQEPTQVDWPTLRQLAVKADVDPRTIAKVLRSEDVRGMAGHRARRALIEAGLLKG